MYIMYKPYKSVLVLASGVGNPMVVVQSVSEKYICRVYVVWVGECAVH